MASPNGRFQAPRKSGDRENPSEEPFLTNKAGKVLPDQNVLAASDASNATGVKPTPVCPPTPQRTPAYLSGRSRVQRQNSLTDTRALLDESGTESPSIKPQHKVSWTTSFRDATILGKGSFSVVFKAISEEDQRAYAVKRTLRPFRSRSERAAILHEFRVSQALGYHPNVIHYKLAWQEEGHVYMQMDLCDHGSYSSLLRSEELNPLPEVTIWNYISAVSNALRYIHNRGLVHLDIKPDNIFIGKNSRLKIGDLGLVRTISRDTNNRPAALSAESAGGSLNISTDEDDEREGEKPDIDDGSNYTEGNDEDDAALHMDHLIGSNDASHCAYLDISRVSSLSDSNESCTGVDDLQPQRPIPSRGGDTTRKNSGHNSSVVSAISHLSAPEDEEGDVRYMAAELLNPGNCKPPADIFSLGMSVLEQVYAAKLPLDGEAWHALREGKLPPLPAELIPQEVSQEVRNALMEVDSISNHDLWNKRSISSENYSWDVKRSDELLSLLLRMVHPDPDCRPTAADILQIAQRYSCDMADDPVLKRFADKDSSSTELAAGRCHSKSRTQKTKTAHFHVERQHPQQSCSPGYEERNKSRPLHIDDLQGTGTSDNAHGFRYQHRNSLQCSTATNPNGSAMSSTQRNTRPWMENSTADASDVKRKDMFTEINFSPPRTQRASATPDVSRGQPDFSPEIEPEKRLTQNKLKHEADEQCPLPSLHSITETPQQKTKSRIYGSLTGRKSQRAGRISPSEDFSHDLSKQFENLYTTTSKCFAAQDGASGTKYDSPRRLKAPFVTSTSRPAAPEALSPRSRHQMYDTTYETGTSDTVTKLDFSKPVVDVDTAETEAENRDEGGRNRPDAPPKPSSSWVNGNPVPFPIKVPGLTQRLRSLSEDGRETPRENCSYRSRENSLSSNSSWNNVDSFPRRLGLNPMVSPSPRCETPNQPIQYNWEV
eukprot:gb/GECG01005656.1/.p1 GENE.gb/GECG01005656.1/~~gb/GECG01005656.1/.p1  ORF type:complete len:942 (+),score=102.94 gb/GECG01005656.1/:1-2826(+)